MQQKQIGQLLVGIGMVLLGILSFVKYRLDEYGAFLCQVVEESPLLTMAQCPAHGDNLSWIILIAFGLVILILAAGVYILFQTRRSTVVEHKHHKQHDTSKLTDEEKMVYTYLHEHDGSAYQSDLIKATGYSKVKMTRVLDHLQAKGIVGRERRGMTNIVVLK